MKIFEEFSEMCEECQEGRCHPCPDPGVVYKHLVSTIEKLEERIKELEGYKIYVDGKMFSGKITNVKKGKAAEAELRKLELAAHEKTLTLSELLKLMFNK